MGIRIPDFPGSEISMDIRSDTPAEAPPVRKMCAGYAGCPSRATRRQTRAGGHSKSIECDEQVRGETLTLNELCDMLADEWDTLRMGICADRADFFP